MVDIYFPRSMPPSLASHRYPQHFSLPPLSLVGHSAITTKDQTFGEAGQSYLDQGNHIVPANIRHGLRTPPGDMTRVSVNPLLAPNYEGFQYKSVPAVNSTTAPRQSSVGTIPNVRYTGRAQSSHDVYHSRNRSQEQNNVTDVRVPKDQTSRHQNGVEAADIVSYLQIPSSINESKGSLAEFAAQVRAFLVCWSFTC